MKIVLTCVLASFLFAPYSAQGHHGWAEFDLKGEITLQGTVTDFHFVNPHCVVEFEVQSEQGQVRSWQGEFSNPTNLASLGWSAESLKAEDKITITGHPARNGGPAMYVTRIRLADGQELKIQKGK